MANLVLGFCVLGLFPRIRHQATTAPDVQSAGIGDQGTDGDGRIHMATHIDVAEATAVGAASIRLQFVDDLHGANLGGAGDRATGEGRFQQLERWRLVG